jgi:hypothetical protein
VCFGARLRELRSVFVDAIPKRGAIPFVLSNGKGKASMYAQIWQAIAPFWTLSKMELELEMRGQLLFVGVQQPPPPPANCDSPLFTRLTLRAQSNEIKMGLSKDPAQEASSRLILLTGPRIPSCCRMCLKLPLISNIRPKLSPCLLSSVASSCCF